jgi:hypothetical protein
MFGFEVSERTVSRLMPRRATKPEAVQRWMAFLRNHRDVIAAMDFFVVPTMTFRLLYVWFAIEHRRRRVVHFNVTDHPHAMWVVQQLREAFPRDTAPRDARRMRLYVIPVVAACAVWFGFVIVYSVGGEQGTIAPVGTALSPIGWMLTALAIMIGFKQRHDDSKRSHLDKLAMAYAKWFEVTWHLVGEMIDEMDKAIRQDIPAISTSLVRLYPRERELRTAATPLLMLERAKERADRVQKMFESLPRWGTKEVRLEDLGNYRTFASDFVAALRKRRDDIEKLFEDAGRAVSPTSLAK